MRSDFKKISRLVVLGVAIIQLGACGFIHSINPWHEKMSGQPQQISHDLEEAPALPIIVDAKTDLIYDEEYTQIQNDPIPLTDVVLEDPKQLNLDEELIHEKRMRTLEQDVASMEQNLNSLAPAYERIAALEQKMANLFLRLETIILEQESLSERRAMMLSKIRDKTVGGAAVADPYMQEEMAKEASFKAPNYTPEVLFKNIRVGQHKDKGRLVMDVSKMTDFKVDLDDQEGILTIELPGAVWQGMDESTFKDPLFKAYTMQAIYDGSGTRVDIMLSRDAEILRSGKIQGGTDRDSRIYIDLYSKSLHGGL